MIKCVPFDTYQGQQVYKYILSDQITVEVVTLGATIVALHAPNKFGKVTDVVLGLCSSQDIANSLAYMGSVVGRCANRIADGQFVLEGKKIQLAKNDGGKNHLHGGNVGFNKKVYIPTVQGNSLMLTTNSPSGEENYPANLDFSVKYTVEGSCLTIEYFAESDGETVVNPTNHAYFNLNGGGCIHDTILQIYAQKYLPVNANLIPTGEERQVCGSAFDFTHPKAIGCDINADDVQLKIAGGYDHNYCLDGPHAATAYSPQTGIIMDCYTDCCGMQLYTGNFLEGEKGKALYGKRDGFCLETQFYPNAVNVPKWKSPIVNGKFYSKTQYGFSVKH